MTRVFSYGFFLIRDEAALRAKVSLFTVHAVRRDSVQACQHKRRAETRTAHRVKPTRTATGRRPGTETRPYFGSSQGPLLACVSVVDVKVFRRDEHRSRHHRSLQPAVCKYKKKKNVFIAQTEQITNYNISNHSEKDRGQSVFTSG